MALALIRSSSPFAKRSLSYLLLFVYILYPSPGLGYSMYYCGQTLADPTSGPGLNIRHVATLHLLFWQFTPFTKAVRRLETHRYIRCFKIVNR
ncbi:hypothetical protein SAMN00120144_0717 [Hymenobacter roseosalivarius DSM 11622]|uniref:Uncharacterized protein n=1 Tax=Hymenobacter roseosalivarius DSM 11622 TaxID=645990 RepID=A0A1W1UR61_9BACT|nr:hypothetical protein SAMN00120144_0717 [Hymenobacter roseosalivarius DSM 11622]